MKLHRGVLAVGHGTVLGTGWVTLAMRAGLAATVARESDS